MASPVRSLSFIAAGMLGSAGLLLFGMVLLTTSRSNSLVFWVSEIVLVVLVWRVVLTPRRTEGIAKPEDPKGLGIATVTSGLVFLAMWIFAVAFSGGRVSLVVILAYVLVSGVFLFLTSIPNRLTRVNYAMRMPLIAAAVVAVTAIGLFYLGGGSL